MRGHDRPSAASAHETGASRLIIWGLFGGPARTLRIIGLLAAWLAFAHRGPLERDPVSRLADAVQDRVGSFVLNARKPW